ncbi:MAG: hypothetical protein Q8922_10525 [Bacteroidota bacterium]|nr:hypothetical protein [Bacteroidota bacterium]MDP4234563.1 hypothetical protein [Bacteroidota bacterium]MDP4243692.1 hypothetical protein [Bacteroidota bacterium]MDP4288360.1 hypothetical protein [Bacteroidota bacterium]
MENKNVKSDNTAAAILTDGGEPETETAAGTPFPFLTGFWSKGDEIAITGGVLFALGMILITAIKTDVSPTGLLIGLLFGGLYGLIIWLALKLYSEMAGVWLNVEESTRIVADIMSRKEAQELQEAGRE